MPRDEISCSGAGNRKLARRAFYASILTRTPPFTYPWVRGKAIRGYREIRRRRRLIYELFGSTRYSRPALHRIDALLEELLPEWGGVFVEAGAYDGYRYSNTYYLERFRGWTGVLIEPIPESYRRCVRDRPRSKVFNCALVAEDGPPSMEMTFRGPVSTSGAATCTERAYEVVVEWEGRYKITIPARTLNSVLAEAGVEEVDLLSLDVEGFEVSVLEGLDLERHRPKFVLVETNGAESAIGELLGASYALLEHVSPNDVLYRRTPTPSGSSRSTADERAHSAGS